MRIPGLLVAIASICASPVAAAERWPWRPVFDRAMSGGFNVDARRALIAELDRCEATKPDADQCLDLMLILTNPAVGFEEPKEAEPYARAAMALAERVFPAGHREIARCARGLGENLQQQARFAEAEPYFRRALAASEGAQVPRGRVIAMDSLNLAENLSAQSRYREAEPLLRRALALREAEQPPDPPFFIAQAHRALAINLQHQARHAEAEPHFRKTLALRQETFRAGHIYIAESYRELAGNLDALGRDDEAEPLYREALTVPASLMGVRHDQVLATWRLADFLRRKQRGMAEARSLYVQASEAALQRVGLYREYGEEAQREARRYRPIFTGRVQAAWDLTGVKR